MDTYWLLAVACLYPVCRPRPPQARPCVSWASMASISHLPCSPFGSWVTSSSVPTTASTTGVKHEWDSLQPVRLGSSTSKIRYSQYDWGQARVGFATVSTTGVKHEWDSLQPVRLGSSASGIRYSQYDWGQARVGFATASTTGVKHEWDSLQPVRLGSSTSGIRYNQYDWGQARVGFATAKNQN